MKLYSFLTQSWAAVMERFRIKIIRLGFLLSSLWMNLVLSLFPVNLWFEFSLFTVWKTAKNDGMLVNRLRAWMSPTDTNTRKANTWALTSLWKREAQLSLFPCFKASPSRSCGPVSVVVPISVLSLARRKENEHSKARSWSVCDQEGQLV